MKIGDTFENCSTQRFILRLSFCLTLLMVYVIVEQHFPETSPNGKIFEYMEGNNARTVLNTAEHNIDTLFKNITQDRPASNDGSTIYQKGTLDVIATRQINASAYVNGTYPETKASECANLLHAIGGNNQFKQNKKVKIGILIPSCTRKLKNPMLKNLSLPTLCLPSLYKTFEKEYLYQVYIGIDKGDYLESVQNELTRLFSNITIVTVVYPIKTFTRSVNAIARQAYEDGVDYFVRINDDTSFETENWTSSALDILQNYTPPNVGVVGPTCKEGNTRILTHDMVHRTHFEIFDSYYPLYFDNKWSDDWITNVYLPGRTTKLKSWIVKHHIGFHGRRYDVDLTKYSRLKQIVSYDKNRVEEYLKRTVKPVLI